MLGHLGAVALVLDAVVLTAAGGLSIYGRSRFDGFVSSVGAVDVGSPLGIAVPLMLTAWIAGIALLGGYRHGVFGAGVEEYKRVISASLITGGLFGVGCYLVEYDLSRGFFLLAFGLGTAALLVERLVLRRVVHQARRHGRLVQSVVIAGMPAHVDEIANVLRREAWLGYRVQGALVPAPLGLEETECGIPVLGSADQALDVVTECGADIIFIAGGALASAEHMRELVWDLEQHNVQVVVAPSVTDVSRERIRIRPVGGLPLVHIDPPRSVNASRRAKRSFDVLASGALLLLFAPIFLFTAVAVRRHDGGPVFFRQTRVGREGVEFSCLKFRTMVVDAEARLAELHQQAGHTEGMFKLRQDPRVTGPGQWLRRYSMDELPQLVNVFRGDMSLVGPRPPLPLEVATYSKAVKRRLRVRPGMTGLWQVSGRSDLSWAEAVRLDLYYVDNWSMIQDVSILMKTFGAVLGSRGAY